MNATEKKFQVRSASAFYNLLPLPFLPSSTLFYFMPEQETCEFQFQMDI